MPNKLRAIDPEVLELACKDGTVFVSNKLQGRIFSEINGTFVHNFVEKLAADPDPVNFNNIGGNSLWPAPEGGDFAYNYPDRSDYDKMALVCLGQAVSKISAKRAAAKLASDFDTLDDELGHYLAGIEKNR